MRIEEACPVPAAQQLLALIRDQYGTIPKFCEAKGLDRLKVARAINGQMVRFDVDFALDIEHATNGAVVADGWRVDDEMRHAIERFRSERRTKGAA
jgi:HD-like signal output (HDOD) protein